MKQPAFTLVTLVFISMTRLKMKIVEVALIYLILLTLRTMAADCQCQHLNRVGEGMKLTVQNTPLHVGDKVCMCCYSMNNSQSQSAAVTFIRNNTTICEVGEGNQQYICKVLKDGIHVLTIEKATEVDQGEWRCETRYNQSNFVSIEVLNATNPIPSTSNTPSVFSNQFVSTTKTTQNNSISKQEPVIYWVIGVAAIIFISVVVGVHVMRRIIKCMELPYDQLLRSAHSSQTAVGRRFLAEELLQMETVTGDGAAVGSTSDNSHSYSSLSSGNADSPSNQSVSQTGSAVVVALATVHTNNVSFRPCASLISSSGTSTNIPPQLSDAERTVLNVVSQNIQRVLKEADSQQSITLTPESVHESNQATVSDTDLGEIDSEFQLIGDRI